MKEDYKKYRQVPPYMTKTGVQIGLLHQEPFEVVVEEDAFNLQSAFLQKHNTTFKRQIHQGDLAVGVVSVIIFIAIIVMDVFHVFG